MLNTSQDNHSVLLKTKAKFDAHSLEIGYNAYRSRYGNIVGMLTQNNIHQHELSTIDIDTYTAQYAYDPENPYVNLKANAFTLRAHNRMNVLNIDQGDNPDWDLQDKIEQNPNLNYPKEWLQIISYGASYVRSGVNLSNFSKTREIDVDTGRAREKEKESKHPSIIIFDEKTRLCSTLKIAYFELIALIYSDGEVPPIEADILRRLVPDLKTKELENFAILKTKELKNLAIALTNQLNFVKTIELLNARSK